jgi:hypothetical protein
MRILWLSILLIYIRFLYENFSAIDIAFSHWIFIWGSLSYQSDRIFIWGSFGYQYCSLIWNFYMRISQLSILLTHMKFLYEDSSAINIAHSHEIFIWETLSYLCEQKRGSRDPRSLHIDHHQIAMKPRTHSTVNYIISILTWFVSSS